MPNKNVLAILSGVVALGLAALAVSMHGDALPVIGATVAALAFFTWGITNPARRAPLQILAIAAGSAALFFHFDNFWGLVVAGLAFVWALVGLVPLMDATWRLKVGFVIAVFLAGGVALWPTAHNMSGGKIPLPRYIADRITFAIAPGLDLRGGMRLAYTVEVDDAIRDKRDRYADDMRQELATSFGLHSGEGRVTHDELTKLEEKVHVAQPETAIIRLTFKDKADESKLDDRFNKAFLTELTEQQGPADGQVTFKIKSDVETQIRDRAVAQAKETISRRVDELGLREAAVTTRDEDIILEVPGSDESSFADIKETIRKTARLEFKMVDDANSTKVFGPPALKEDQLPPDEGLEQRYEGAPDGLDANGKKKSATAYFVRIACQPPKYPKETMTECLQRFKSWASTLSVPDDHVIGFETVTEPVPDTDPLQFHQVGYRTLYLFNRAEVTGDSITDASVGQDQQNFGQYYVSLTFSPSGADRFEEITGANVNRRFAIILDDVVDSAPVIRSKIGGGHAQISMGAGDQEKQLHDAKQLEMVLRSGALPAPITPSSESIIGPSLGADAIHQGVRGAFYGVLAVLVFMIFYYRKSGFVADVAVLFNLFLQMALLASFSATMTLPGIAGLALTIGMSVDANVLINERIREELRSGKTVRAAVEAGYTRAWPSIVDGHATVFISGLILMQYGSGPVKGFAVALVIGIICSLFTGFFCTRLVFDWWVRGAKVKRLSVGAEF
ncbi:MAG TPA: protein translocase subunit SecD [Polyangiaceae bacterium]|jgi:preprotein translocase subunit SecD